VDGYIVRRDLPLAHLVHGRDLLAHRLHDVLAVIDGLLVVGERIYRSE
jgi:hypothetical protein